MGPSPDFTKNRLYKGERLKRKKLIDRLFKEGTQNKHYPILLFVLRYTPERIPFHQVLISVPKKHFKKSVVRNKIKRLIREAYRTHKYMLYNNKHGLPFLLGYVYISKDVPTYAVIEKSVVTSIRYLIKQKNQKNEVAKS